MSVQRWDFRMGQPEQWLSEHEPWATLAIVGGALVLCLLVGFLA